jgi:hypothetical protein
MTRTVGHQDRSDIVLDPAQALQRGRALDRLLPALLPARPRGVMRAPHHVFNRIDDERQLQIARLLNRQVQP